MEFVTEGWKNGPTCKRDLADPGKIKKDSIFFTTFGMVYFLFFIFWELSAAFGTFLWRLIVRPEPKSLRGKVCLVTGTGRGLGRQLSLALAREGAVIACADINETNNEKTVAMLKDLGAKAVAYTVNVAIKKDIEEVVSRIEKELGPVYLLVNNAAIIYTKTNVDEEFIRAAYNVNVMAPLWLTYAVLPMMKKRNEGHIVNISSIGAKMVCSPLMIYGSTKVALAYIGDCFRSEMIFAKKNIGVTNVHQTIMNSSEDYLRNFPMKINMAIEMEEVVTAVMDAIHYNYDEVVVPSIAKYPLLMVKEMMPSRTSNKLIELIFEKFNIPNEEQLKLLPGEDMLKQCSLMEKNLTKLNN